MHFKPWVESNQTLRTEQTKAMGLFSFVQVLKPEQVGN